MLTSQKIKICSPPSNLASNAEANKSSPFPGDETECFEYTFEALRQDEEFILYRGHPGHQDGANQTPILALTPVLERPALASLRRMEHEYSLRAELEVGWALQPLALASHEGQTMLVLTDSGGELLEGMLGKPMEVTRFLRLAIGLSVAVRQMHARGFVHKDLKPANIMVNRESAAALLTGFGIASRVPRERHSPDPPETIAGTLAYMAPEQTGRMNRSVDARSDLYALGVTLYEMLTGMLPFTASDPMEWIHCHIARQPVSPAERVDGVPASVAAIVMKLLAKTAEDRYQTAAGLEGDLQRCLVEWEQHGRIAAFALAKHDIPDRLVIPEKLYGRESEVDTLLTAFDRIVKSGKPELVLVSGYSGIGKSSVVNELHKPLVPPRGIFASGKFDQYKRDIPYSTLAQAFQTLIRGLLAKSEAELTIWRDALREALGTNGRLVTEVVPDLSLIIGEQPAVPELPPQDARGRFQLVFRRFVGVFARPEHPLALFLDDLQWLDAATLDLMEDLLTQPEVRHLMLIGAYRDNEVGPTHPLARKLQAMRQAGAVLQDIVLAPLAPEDLEQLITDSLHCEPGQASSLAELIHDKTTGNPFFAIQFTSALFEEGLLIFEHAKGKWSWDLDRIHAKGYTDNVVDLMVRKLTRLDPETQNALKQLACLGNSADFAMICLVCQLSMEQMHSRLAEAVRLGFILCSKNSYHFLHDRVQEAAYSLIPEELRAQAHLRIGRLMESHTPPDNLPESIFEIVNQLNRGLNRLTSIAERERVAGLNLIAATRAKASTAYDSALKYLHAGRGLLADETWDHNYDLIFSIECLLAECELLTTVMDAAESRLSVLAERARSVHGIALVARLRLTLYTALDRSDRAVDVFLEYWRYRGTDWPAHPTEEVASREYDRIWTLMGSRQIEDLMDLPLVTNREALDDMDVFTEIVTPAMFIDDKLLTLVICRMVTLSLEHGNSDGSCYAYVWLGMLAGHHFGNYQAGFRFGKLGYDLVEERALRRYQARTYMSFGTLVAPWTRHIKTARELQRRCFDAASRSGDLTYTAYSCNVLYTNYLAAGDSLGKVQSEAETGLEFATKIQFGLVIACITAQLGLVRTLRGLTTKFGTFNDDRFDELRFERHLASTRALALPECWYWIRKLQARYSAGDYAAAIDAAVNAERLLWTSPAFFENAEYHFYSALSRAASCDSASDEVRNRHLETLAWHQKQQEIWAKHCPENFEHRAALVGAEIARIEGRVLEAEQLYEQALRSTHLNGFIHDEALAYELAARFYAARGFKKFADAYLLEARYCYKRWGADGKVAQLDLLYPQIKQQSLPTSSTSTIVAPSELMDLGTVIKVSQAVSGEMVLEKLIENLMRAAIEHAGAERGLLIFPRGDELLVEAEATTTGNDVTVTQPQASVNATVVPESLIRYVLRTRHDVILDDAVAGSQFSTDAYIVEHHLRSILCLPLVNSDVLVGVLYLENNLTPRVFTQSQMAVIKLLASQAAISLANTRLYRDLQIQESKMRRLVDSNIIGIVIWDLDGRLIDANDAFLRMVQHKREDLQAGLRWFDMTPPEWQEAHARYEAEELKATGMMKVREKEFFRKDGSRVPVLIGAACFEGQPDQGVAYILDLTERKQVESALRHSEEQYRVVVETANEAVVSIDDAGRIVFANQATHAIFGYAPAELCGRPLMMLMAESFRPPQCNTINWYLESGVKSFDGRSIEVTGRRKSGEEFPIEVSLGEVVKDGQRMFTGCIRDITERVRTEKAKAAQARQASVRADVIAAFAETPSLRATLASCAESIVRHLGAAFARIWTLDESENTLVLQASSGLYTRLDGTHGRVAMGQLKIGRIAQEAKAHLTNDLPNDERVSDPEWAKREGMVAFAGYPLAVQGRVTGVLAMFARHALEQSVLDALESVADIIAQGIYRKEAEDKLRQRERSLRLLTETIPQMIWSANASGAIDYCNRQILEYTGRQEDQLWGEAWAEVIHPDDLPAMQESWQNAVTKQLPTEVEFRQRRADGTFRWCLSRAQPLRDEQGRVIRWYGSITDLDDWKRAQDTARKTQAELAHITRVMTMGELASSIAHEINQPLGAIVNYGNASLRLLGGGHENIEEVKRAISKIIGDANRASAIIAHIRALSRKSPPVKGRLNVRELIDEVMVLARHELQARLITAHISSAENLPAALGDRIQIQQVLLNLVMNGIEAMSAVTPKDRTLMVRADLHKADRQCSVLVRIQDAGMGLRQEDASRLFEAFYTTKPNGLGMGLAISRSIVEAHGGKLWAEPNDGPGAAFCFVLPTELQNES